MKKKVISRTVLQFTPDFPGLSGVNIMARQFPIEPFLVFTEFRMERPVFGPHPHAGISVLTYMLPDSKGSFFNRDSLGDFSTIEPGGLHITQAGSGIHHDEFPTVTGLETHGFQIWINHSRDNRLVAPQAMHAAANQIPEVASDSHRIRILLGAFEKEKALHSLVTPVTLLHIFLKPSTKIELPAEAMAFVYGLQGAGKSDGNHFSGQVLLNYEASGNVVHIEAGETGVEFMFGSGTPLHEPIVYGGPFVMTSQEQMIATQQRYAQGLMGSLAPFRI